MSVSVKLSHHPSSSMVNSSLIKSWFLSRFQLLYC